MLHLHIITLGSLKESYWLDAQSEYLKRLQAFAKVVIHELKEESFKENDPVDMIKEKEAIKIKKELEKIKDTYVIALEERGKERDSVTFSKHLHDLAMKHSSSITFVIGGPLGLAPTITQTARETLSFSPMTFTHQMIRIILLEQLYRAMMIANNRKYHY